MNQYPSWRYHRTEPARIVADAVEDAELGTEWADTPAKFEDAPEPEPEKKTSKKKPAAE